MGRLVKLNSLFKSRSRLVKQAQYEIQVFDDGYMSEEEKDFSQLALRIRVFGQPQDPDKIIPDILPKVQQYIKAKYPAYNIDNITYDNFNPETAQKSQRFPNEMDFYFTADFSYGA